MRCWPRLLAMSIAGVAGVALSGPQPVCSAPNPSAQLQAYDALLPEPSCVAAESSYVAAVGSRQPACEVKRRRPPHEPSLKVASALNSALAESVQPPREHVPSFLLKAGW